MATQLLSQGAAAAGRPLLRPAPRANNRTRGTAGISSRLRTGTSSFIQGPRHGTVQRILSTGWPGAGCHPFLAHSELSRYLSKRRLKPSQQAGSGLPSEQRRRAGFSHRRCLQSRAAQLGRSNHRGVRWRRCPSVRSATYGRVCVIRNIPASEHGLTAWLTGRRDACRHAALIVPPSPASLAPGTNGWNGWPVLSCFISSSSLVRKPCDVSAAPRRWARVRRCSYHNSCTGFYSESMSLLCIGIRNRSNSGCLKAF